MAGDKHRYYHSTADTVTQAFSGAVGAVERAFPNVERGTLEIVIPINLRLASTYQTIEECVASDRRFAVESAPL